MSQVYNRCTSEFESLMVKFMFNKLKNTVVEKITQNAIEKCSRYI